MHPVQHLTIEKSRGDVDQLIITCLSGVFSPVLLFSLIIVFRVDLGFEMMKQLEKVEADPMQLGQVMQESIVVD